jgi:O-antigen/teichoic acid export membrane protein
LQIFHKRNLPIAREALWTALGQGLSILGSLALIRILTSYLTSAEYGYCTPKVSLVQHFLTKKDI